MSADKTKMIEALRKIVLPVLKENKFEGNFPHYRRFTGNKVDLFSFQFNKYGGGFLIEISYALTDNLSKYVYKWLKDTKPENLTVADAIYRKRFAGKYGWFYYWNLYEKRFLWKKHIYPVKPGEQIFTKGKVNWVQVIDDSIYEKLANQILPYLSEAEKYWADPNKFNPK